MRRVSLRVHVARTLVVSALVAAAVLVWRFNLRDNLSPRNFGVVEEGKVFRSGRLSVRATSDVVRQHAIRTIVDLGAYPLGSPEERVAKETAEALGVKRHRLPDLAGDGTGDPQQYVEALRIMSDPANQPVLVHCGAGAQRTSACVMMYKARQSGRAWTAFYDESLNYKQNPRKNAGMLPFLEEWGERIIFASRDDATTVGSAVAAPPVR